MAFKCARCGKASVPSSGARCGKCNALLAKKKQTPGSPERSWKVANDAKRREDGKTNKAKKKSKGKGDVHEIARKIRTAEKKTGQKLSPDRKNLGEGYTSSNVRAIPIPLNRGRHHANPKKVRAWQEKLHKMGYTDEQFATMVLAKSASQEEKNELYSILNILGPEFIERYIKGE